MKSNLVMGLYSLNMLQNILICGRMKLVCKIKCCCRDILNCFGLSKQCVDADCPLGAI